MLINELTVEAEKLEDIIRAALKGVEGLQEENKQKANELTQRFSLFAGMFGSFGTQSLAGQTAIPTAAQKAAANLITSFAALLGRDELDSDPAVKQLRVIIQTVGLGTVEAIAAQSKLNDIFAARDQIAKAQLAFKVYETFGNKTQMNAVHLQAEEARQKLASLGVDEVHYEAGKDLSVYFKQPAVNQEENKQKANELTQRFSLFAGMFGSFGTQSIAGQTAIPTAAQKAAANLITSFAALLGRDELDSDPAVKQLRVVIQTAGLGTVEAIAAQSKLNDIFAARDQIAKAQLAFKVYETFGNKAQMIAVHLQAEEARQKLASLGVDEVHYEAGKDLSVYFKQPAAKACDYDPSITTGSVPLPDNETYAFLLRMSAVAGAKGDWAKQQ
ncbi:hypothetical protein QW71_26375, partial [Paenibacillus sp. IHB B 3415]